MVETNLHSGTKGEADDADGDGAEVEDGQPGVDFINILRTDFLLKSLCLCLSDGD
jgi:hypothetical protein